MRTSVRRITASSQTRTGTTRTTCSSPSTTPMTTLTHCTCTSTDAWRTCTDLALRIFHSSWWHRTPHGSSSESIHSHPRSYSWRVLFDSTSPFFLYLFFLPFSVFFLHTELFLELDNPIVMASLRYSAAEESENTMNVFHSHTSGESMGSSGSKWEDKFMWRIGNEEETSSWKSSQNKPRDWRITQNLSRRDKSSEKIEDWRIVSAAGVRSFNCESKADCNSGFLESGEFSGRRENFWRSWHSEQLRGIPRSLSTCSYSEFQRNE